MTYKKTNAIRAVTGETGMVISHGELTPIPAGKVATIVTCLEMTEKPRVTEPSNDKATLQQMLSPTPSAYRQLFRAVGEQWMWVSRLTLSDRDLGDLLTDPGIEIFAVRREGSDIGMLELDLRTPHQVEIAFVGLIPSQTGKGLGGWLIGEALRLAWRQGIRRVWIHTCTLDHPAALRLYRKWGFRPFARTLEVFDDPRLDGTLARDAAPHVPLIEPDGS